MSDDQNPDQNPNPDHVKRPLVQLGSRPPRPPIIDPNWNQQAPTWKRKPKVKSSYSSPSEIYEHANEPILTRRRHNGHICAICGYRVHDFAHLAGVSSFSMNSLLFRHHISNTLTMQRLVDAINMVKGEQAVDLNWIIRYFRHDISDLTAAEQAGTFEWQTHSYSRKIQEHKIINQVNAMTHVIRKHITSPKMRRLGIVPATIVNTLHSVEQLRTEVADAGSELTDQAARAHLDRIESNQVKLSGPLLKRRGPGEE